MRGIDVTIEETGDVRIAWLTGELVLSQDEAHRLWQELGALKNQPAWTGPKGWGGHRG